MQEISDNRVAKTTTDNGSLTDYDASTNYSTDSDMSISDDSFSLSDGSWVEEDITPISFKALLVDDKHSSTLSRNKNKNKNKDINSESEETEDNDNLDDEVSTVYLEEDTILDLMGEKANHSAEFQKETLVDNNDDIIATMNIRNKYDHALAAEFFISNNLTFLSLQEPFPSPHTESSTWKSFKKMELGEARISCFETPHQVILFDKWKWGGKTIANFRSFQHGRVTSIAFGFDNGQKVGIISVYASTRGALGKTPEDKDTLQLTVDTIREIMRTWYHNFPNICIMVLGDLQETITTLDIDNLGNYRLPYPKDGIISSLHGSHESIVRKLNSPTEYWTRVGHEGARGIDHILYPTREDFQTWITATHLDKKNVAGAYFPSDHRLLSCTLRRFGQNNNCSGTSSIKFNYGRIFNIKMKREGTDGTDLSFDDNQFKDCRTFKDQVAVLTKLREITNDSAANSNDCLSSVEKRIKNLYQKLWKDGLAQNVDGPNNQLIKINDEHALDLAYIFRKFNDGIKQSLWRIKLTTEVQVNEKAGTTRGRLRKHEGFKLFANLPITTKLRYLGTRIKHRIRSVDRGIYWINEFNLRKKNKLNPLPFEDIKDLWDIMLKTDSITSKATKIHENLLNELETRDKHIEAILFEMDQANMSKHQKPKNRSRAQDASTEKPSDTNAFPDISPNLIHRFNSWLGREGCTHCFNLPHNKDNMSFLTKDFAIFVNLLQKFNPRHVNEPTDEDITALKNCLSNALDSLKSTARKLSRLQQHYKHSTLLYLLRTNKIEQFTKKVLFKDRAAPETHKIIWDDTLGAYRDCTNELEEMLATKLHHNKWMGNSKAKTTCAFASIRHEPGIGARGVTLDPTRKISKSDINHLIHNGNSLPNEIKDAFINAHQNHTKKLFQAPETRHAALNYPFYLTNEDGKMNEDDKVRESYFKAITAIPGKARHEGFQLAVLGRFGKRWQLVMLNLIKLMLIMRYLPNDVKKISRFPIPKPGKQNEYRPISLCTDTYCFVNALCTVRTSAAIEKLKILHEGITAYRKGRGCANLVATELCFREDCREGGIPSAQVDEDEEKFFDRIPVQILLASMVVCGFPDQGYVELKANAMEGKHVEIITSKGVIYARFVCGLEQGNPDSPTIANLVIRLKHEIWKTLTERVKNILIRNDSHKLATYNFNKCDPRDAKVTLSRIGYSDDNSIFCSAYFEEDLIPLTTHFLQMAGDLSMVTKIGRKSSKCELQFYNVSANFVINLEECTSYAWSFESDGPIKEKVPVKVFLNKEELRKFYIQTDFQNLEEEEQQKWCEIINPIPHKHLGLTSTLSGDTSQSGESVIAKMKERIVSLKMLNMHEDTQLKCANMLCATMHSFAPLQMNFNSLDLRDVDNLLISIVRKSRGLTNSDCKHKIFLDKNIGGLGFLSNLEVDISAVAREIEVGLNGILLDSKALRARSAAIFAFDNDDNLEIQTGNHIRDAIHKLGRFGIQLRDADEHIINSILCHLSQRKTYAPIGTDQYKDSNKCSINNGKPLLLKLCFGSDVHRVLRLIEENDWNFKIQHKFTRLPVAISTLEKTFKKVRDDTFNQLTNCYNCWEWLGSSLIGNNTIPAAFEEWNKVDVTNILKWKYPNSYWLLKPIQIREEARSITNINFNARYQSLPNNCSKQQTAPNKNPRWCDNPHVHITETIANSKSPIFIATDGGLVKDTMSSSQEQPNNITATAAITICILDIRGDETLDSKEWVNRPMKPLMSRIVKLPTEIGTNETDIAMAECWAMCLQEEALPKSIPRIVITDSSTARSHMQYLVREGVKQTDRFYIRTILSGVCKSIISRLHHSACIHSDTTSIIRGSDKESLTPIRNTLNIRMEKFLAISKEWTTTTILPEVKEAIGWKPQYWDDHHARPVFKIDSHQLNPMGNAIAKNRRYPEIIPNLSLTSANHFADSSATIAMKIIPKHAPNLLFYQVPSDLNFTLTWLGKNIEKQTGNFVHTIIQKERVKRIKTKPTQGLLWRWYPHSHLTWGTLKLHKGWLRSLCGLSRTHTRGLYKSNTYRTGCLNVYCDSSKNPETPNKLLSLNVKDLIRHLSPCIWCDQYQQSNLSTEDKGNRKHYLLFCSNTHIRTFRENVNNLIEEKLANFFNKLASYTSRNFTIQTIISISDIFLLLHKQQTGRLLHIDTETIPCPALIPRTFHQYKSPTAPPFALNTKQPIFLHIFGLTPPATVKNLKDTELGIVDGPWMGIIPMQIHEKILKTCKSLQNFILDISQRKGVETELISKWKEIVSIFAARAIGIHRVINLVSKNTEKAIRAKYELDEGTFAKKKALKRELLNETENHTKKVQLLEKTENEITLMKPLPKTCIGITCNQLDTFWNTNQVHAPCTIQSEQKQCMRCRRQIMNMKKGISYLKSLLSTQNSASTILTLTKFCETTNTNKIPYKSMLKLLNTSPSAAVQIEKQRKPFSTAKTNPFTQKDKKITDYERTVCKLIIKCINRRTCGWQKGEDKIKWAIHTFQHAINENEIRVQQDKEEEIKLHSSLFKKPDATQNNATSIHHINTSPIRQRIKRDHKSPCSLPNYSPITNPRIKNHTTDKKPKPNYQIEPPIIDLTENDTHIEFNTLRDAGKTNTDQLHNSIDYINIKRRGRLLSGHLMLKAIVNLRKNTDSNTFIGNSESTEMILAWTYDAGWGRFGRIFNNNRAKSEKPNGVYLIPLFSGALSMGHWYFIVIDKNGRTTTGWHLDSLGSQTLNRIIKSKIEKAFTPNRGSFSWTSVSCQTQAELECGPRVITGFKTIIDGLRNKLTTQECIDKAARAFTSDTDGYSSMTIRNIAAGIIQNSDTTSIPKSFLHPIHSEKRQRRPYKSKSRTKRNNPMIIDLT